MRNILIVDDEPNIRLMLRTTLEVDGYVVREVGGSREAIEAIQQEPPNVVLLDVRMAGKDGMTVLEFINLRPPEQRPRVIVLTAHGSIPLAIKALRLGAFDFLEKPVIPDDVRISVASALNAAPIEPPTTESKLSHAEALRLIRKELWKHNYGNAQAMLARSGTEAQNDPDCLNLLGVLHELEGRTRIAKKFYNMSLRAQPSYDAAMQNLYRLQEIETYGESRREIAMGDEAELLDGFIGRIGPSHLDQIRRIVY